MFILFTISYIGIYLQWCFIY